MVPEEGRGDREGEIWWQESKVWKDIRDMQQGRKELLPSRSAVIPDEEGALATVRTLTTRDGAGTSPRFLTSRANMMQRCWNQ